MWQRNGFFAQGLYSPGMGLVTRRLLMITVGVFVVDWLLWPNPAGGYSPFERVFGLSRRGLSSGMLWQVLTYTFLHGGFLHLLGNMIGLLFFGSELEQRLGGRRFLLLYLGCGALGGLGWLLLSAGDTAVCIGASAAVLGVIGTFAALYPTRRITLLVFYVLPVTLTARMLALITAGGSLLLMRSNAGGIAHSAHLAGGVAGYLYGLWIDGVRMSPRSSWRPDRVFADWKARLRRGRFRVMDSPADNTPVDWDDVDRILIKIRAMGMGSLTVSERELLERASRQVR